MAGRCERDERHAAGQARGQPVLPRGRGQVSDAGTVNTGRAGRGCRRVPAGLRSGAGARAGRGGDRRGRAGARHGRAGHAPVPRCETTPPPICYTPLCASGSGRHVRQAAPTWDRTSCVSTSPTVNALRREELRDVEARVNEWVAADCPCARSRRRSTRRARSARWPCSAKSTATGCGWSRWTTSRASCAAARTCSRRPRSGSFMSRRRRRAPPTFAGSRR